MNAILTTVIPVFALIALGFVAARMGVISKDGGVGLNRFVNYFAVPALLFRTMLNIEISDTVPWSLWGSYYLAAMVIWLIVLIIARQKSSLREAGGSAVALGSTFGNLVLMGIPLGFVHFGERALLPAALIVAIHAPVQWLAGTLVAEWAGRGVSKPIYSMVFDLVRNVALNPLVMSLALGLVWNIGGFGLHPIVDKIITLLGQGAVPTALFAIGLSIANYSFKGQTGTVLLVLALKMALFPAIAYVLAFHVFALSPINAAMVVLLAAMPPGVNAYMFANRYNANVAAISGAVAAGTALAAFTIPIILWWLGPV